MKNATGCNPNRRKFLQILASTPLMPIAQNNQETDYDVCLNSLNLTGMSGTSMMIPQMSGNLSMLIHLRRKMLDG